MRKPAETVVLTEDVRVPGTDIILEKGDKVQIFPKEEREEKEESRKPARKRSNSVLRKEFREKMRKKLAERKKQ